MEYNKPVTSFVASAEDTEVIVADSDPLLSLKSAHDDRYEEFEAFMKAQREFNNKIESQISMNSVALNENVIELQECNKGSQTFLPKKNRRGQI